jgi:4-carboxymuconolactone decarboxylase
MMMPAESSDGSFPVWTDELRHLVRLAAAIAGSDEDGIRGALADAAAVRTPWVEEVILQSYLFAGFPRALNAAREWRRVSGVPAPTVDSDAQETAASTWRAAGEVTCAQVYGDFYEPLRRNIRQLHPALDAWMIVEGYGKVLSRPALDLVRRELCIVAACLAAGQDRQLHAHLHGALNVGATPADLRACLSSLTGLVPDDAVARGHHLFSRVVGA